MIKFQRTYYWAWFEMFACLSNWIYSNIKVFLILPKNNLKKSNSLRLTNLKETSSHSEIMRVSIDSLLYFGYHQQNFLVFRQEISWGLIRINIRTSIQIKKILRITKWIETNNCQKFELAKIIIRSSGLQYFPSLPHNSFPDPKGKFGSWMLNITR